jgi:hypothetical protein
MKISHGGGTKSCKATETQKRFNKVIQTRAKPSLSLQRILLGFLCASVTLW